LDTGRFVAFAASNCEALSGVIVCTLLRTQTTSAISSPVSRHRIGRPPQPTRHDRTHHPVTGNPTSHPDTGSHRRRSNSGGVHHHEVPGRFDHTRPPRHRQAPRQAARSISARSSGVPVQLLEQCRDPLSHRCGQPRMLAGAGRSTAHAPGRATPGTWLVAATTTPRERGSEAHTSRGTPRHRVARSVTRQLLRGYGAVSTRQIHTAGRPQQSGPSVKATWRSSSPARDRRHPKRVGSADPVNGSCTAGSRRSIARRGGVSSPPTRLIVVEQKFDHRELS
jgi:hypothetical protein